jgi:hypothetical protein
MQIVSCRQRFTLLLQELSIPVRGQIAEMFFLTVQCPKARMPGETRGDSVQWRVSFGRVNILGHTSLAGRQYCQWRLQFLYSTVTFSTFDNK